jgi:hypothetical protein
MPLATSVCVSRLTVDLDSPVFSAISPFPSNAEPALNARRISMPLSKDRLGLEILGLSARGACTVLEDADCFISK